MTTETLAERLGKCVRTVAWEAGERDQRRAYTPLGELVVTFFGGKWHHAGLPCATMLEAQAAAQADYTARILAALDLDAIARLVAEAVEMEREGCARFVDCGCDPAKKAIAANGGNSGDRWRACQEANCGAQDAAAIRARADRQTEGSE